MTHALSKLLACLLVVSVWLGVFVMAMAVYRGPAPADEYVAANQFSAATAMATLRRILADEKPHPAGSVENDAVRTRLLAEISALGMTAEIHATSHSDLLLKNVLVRLPNSASQGKPLLLVTHYDSARAGPGAGDAGSAIAALLETARILRQEKLERPVYLLFTDGEERGLLGAKQWVKEHPLAQLKPLVLNFDARGDRGASLLFETHANNRRFVAWMASRLPTPIGTGSAFVTVYRQLPNGTDFSEFRRAGMQGANFALIGGVQRYHTANDTLANLDPRSVQHHGENALALARALAADPNVHFEDDQDAIFFDVLGMFVIWYPIWFARLMATATFIFFVAAPIYLQRARLLRAVSVRVLAAIVLSASAATAVGWAIKEPAQWALSAEPSAVAWMIALILYIWLTSICLLYGTSYWLVSSHTMDELWWSVWLFWSFLGLVATWLVPGVSYFVSVPACLAAIACWQRHVVWRTTLSTIGVAVLVVPSLYLLPIALRVTAASVVALFIVIALSSLMPFMGSIPRGKTENA